MSCMYDKRGCLLVRQRMAFFSVWGFWVFFVILIRPIAWQVGARSRQALEVISRPGYMVSETLHSGIGGNNGGCNRLVVLLV
jgi:hypothetical protein